MKYQLLEDDIKNKLTTDLGLSIDVSASPDSTSEFERPFIKPKVWVVYLDSDYDKPQSVNAVSQHEVNRLELVIIARVKRGVNGIFEIHEKVKNSVLGYKPQHHGRIYLKSFKQVTGIKEGLFTYSLTIETPSLVVENTTEATTPLFVTAASTTNIS